MINNKKVLAVIPARYGSKRLPKKNLLKINKKTLIEVAYSSAIKSKFIDKVIVSTESRKIKKICDKISKKIVLHRPKFLSRDNVGSEKVILDVIKKIGKEYFYIVLLQATSPLRTTSDIDKALKKIEYFDFDNLVSIFHSKEKKKYCISINKNLIFKSKRKKKNTSFLLNGAIYISKKKIFIKSKKFFTKKTGYIIMPKSRSIDVDYESDYLKVKKILEKL